jgi:hypothetical protein
MITYFVADNERMVISCVLPWPVSIALLAPSTTQQQKNTTRPKKL